MQVVISNESRMKSIAEIATGNCFTAERTNKKDGMGYYLKIDGNSGIISKKYGNEYAVNLHTGQLRCFSCSALVQPIDTQVTVY